MGIDYSTRVAFGTFAKHGTEAHRRLEEIYSEAEGGPVDVDGVDGASVAQHGNSWSGDFRYSIEAGKTISMTSRSASYEGPLTIEPGAAEKVTAAIKSLDLSETDFEPIGHYIILDV